MPLKMTDLDSTTKETHSDADFYRARTDTLVTRLREGIIPYGVFGADSDVLTCFGGDIIDARKIEKGGFYILRPIDMDYGEGTLVQRFEDVLMSLKEHKVDDLVELRALVNVGDLHWRLLKVKAEQQVIQSIELWDPLSGGEATLYATPAFNTIEKGFMCLNVKMPLQATFGDTQDNGFMCMDHCIHEVYRESSLKNEVTSAADSMQLRLAVARQIAHNHQDLGSKLAKQLTISLITRSIVCVTAEAEKIKIPAEQQAVIDAAIETYIAVSKMNQENFDGVFARHLQEMYDKESDLQIIEQSDEAELIEHARYKAAQEIYARSQTCVEALPESYSSCTEEAVKANVQNNFNFKIPISSTV